MNETIQRFLKLADTALADSLVEELSARGRCKACYDAAAYCCLAFAEAKGRNLLDVEWSSIVSSLAGEEGFPQDVGHSAITLSNIRRDCESGEFPPESKADVPTARVCALHISKVVTAWLQASA